MAITVAEQLVPVVALSNTTTNGGASSDYTRIDRDVRCTAIVQLQQAAAHATVITVYQADDAAASNVEVLDNAVPVWYNLDTGSASVLTRGTDAKNYTVTAVIKPMLVVFQLDPRLVTKPWVMITLSDSSEAGNFATVTFLHEVNTASDAVATLI